MFCSFFKWWLPVGMFFFRCFWSCFYSLLNESCVSNWKRAKPKVELVNQKWIVARNRISDTKYTIPVHLLWEFSRWIKISNKGESLSLISTRTENSVNHWLLTVQIRREICEHQMCWLRSNQCAIKKGWRPSMPISKEKRFIFKTFSKYLILYESVSWVTKDLNTHFWYMIFV